MTGFSIADRKPFRKNLIIPAEHGSWSWLLVPFVVGAATTSRVLTGGDFSLLSALLVLVGGLCAFLIRQPASLWLRIRRGRANPANESLVAGWTMGLAAVAGICLAGLLALGRVALLWLVIPFGVVLLFYLGAARIRALGSELIGAFALALMAPAAAIAVTGRLSDLAWALWGLMGIQNALGVLYVRLRLADTHQRPTNRPAAVWGHVIGLGAVLAAGLAGWVPMLAAIPFAAVLLRAIWAVRDQHPVSDVKRFGFTEVGVEVLSGVWILASYWLY